MATCLSEFYELSLETNLWYTFNDAPLSCLHGKLESECHMTAATERHLRHTPGGLNRKKTSV